MLATLLSSYNTPIPLSIIRGPYLSLAPDKIDPAQPLTDLASMIRERLLAPVIDPTTSSESAEDTTRFISRLDDETATMLLAPSWMYLRARLICSYVEGILTDVPSGGTSETTSAYGNDLNTFGPVVWDEDMPATDEQAYLKFSDQSMIGSYEAWTEDSFDVLTFNGTYLAPTWNEQRTHQWPRNDQAQLAYESTPARRSIQFAQLPIELCPASPYASGSKVSPAKLMRRLNQELIDQRDCKMLLGQLFSAVRVTR